MKKLFLFFSILFAMSANAQNIDETELLGKWNVSSKTGTLPLDIINFTGFVFGYTTFTDDYYRKYDYSGYITGYEKDYGDKGSADAEDVPITDFFISNNDKLHIGVTWESTVLRFIIESLTETSMTLKTYDGQCSISLTKDNSAAVRSTIINHTDDTSIYNLAGKKVKKITSDGVYIKMGQKNIMKK